MALTIEQKANLVSAARASEIAMRRTMIQSFFFIHSAILSLVLTQFESTSAFYFAAFNFGLWLVRIWYLSTRRADHLIEYWNSKLEELELHQASMIEESRKSSVSVFIRAEQKIPGTKTSVIFAMLVKVFGVVWTWLFLESFFEIIKKS